jgi:hypothetical protein
MFDFILYAICFIIGLFIIAIVIGFLLTLLGVGEAPYVKNEHDGESGRPIGTCPYCGKSTTFGFKCDECKKSIIFKTGHNENPID